MYCSGCGGKLTTVHQEGRARRYCSACNRIHYRNPKPCAGVCVVDGEQLLLIKRTAPPAVGAWSLPAGYLEVDEPPAYGAVRELAEETSVKASAEELTLHDTVLVEHPDGRSVLVIVFVIPRTATTGTPVAGSDAAAAEFWEVDGLLADSNERIEPGYQDVFRAAVERVAESCETGSGLTDRSSARRS
ncbi:NUDIX hydrolase [Halorarius halobius]|uniref:NUDIX hydrolase n=1 Tax=Halorarius halobius TaxID=2962671 RepID=UPI0033133B99